MRKLSVCTFVSLDGVIEGHSGPDPEPTEGFAYEGWAGNYWDETLTRYMDDSLSAPFDLLLGRKTYEIFAAY